MMTLIAGFIALAVIGTIAFKIVAFFVSGLTGRQTGSSDHQLHPSLTDCPGCGAELNETAEVCAHCGLRVSR